ncbi:MAG: dihydropteroate synthase [Phycisphaerales bacterium]|nr:MAG: dihydropteroate synthase [Phycisphaerales bacterium]
MKWFNRRGAVPCQPVPAVMGVLNVTPDSFSDGGAYAGVDDAVRTAERMLDDGASVIDVGGESTRPGSTAVDAAVQIERTAPVIRELRARRPRAFISVDTRLAAVAAAALDAGADIVNDVSALRDDPKMAALVAERSAGLVLMHMRGTPRDMQAGGGPVYHNVVREVREFLIERTAAAVAAGVLPSQIALDPGIGFGKRPEDNLALLSELRCLVALGQPVLVGASRKSFIGQVLGIDDPGRRLAGSLACAVHAFLHGAAILRVHDVRETVEAVRMASALLER